MSARTNDAVARAIWPWRGEDGSGAVRRGLPRPVRALLDAIPASAVSLVLFFGFHMKPAAYAVGAVAGAILLCGAFAPRWFRAIERAQESFGRVIGLAITWILLGAVFAACFVPGRLLLLARGRDPLQRKAFRSGGCAWIVRDAAFDPARYERHY
jgi:hypothetical protein